MAKRTARIHFEMHFEGDVDYDTDDELQKTVDNLTTGEVWDDPDWLLEQTKRQVVSTWENDEDDDEDA